MKCKGCTEQIDYWPLARVLAERPQDYYSAGPALTHSGEACEWFKATDTGVIKAYIENEKAKIPGFVLSPEGAAKMRATKNRLQRFKLEVLNG